MTVLMAGPTPPPRNGMSVTTQTLLQNLPDGSVCLVLVDTADRRGLRNVGRLDLDNIGVAMRCGLRFVRELIRKRPDVVYVPIAQNSLGFVRDSLFLLPARALGRPVVVHLHGSAFNEFYRGAPRLVRLLVRAALSDVSAAVVLGRSALGQFEGIVPASRLCVVENGIPDRRLPDVEPGRSGLSARRGLVLCLGSLSTGKGFQDVLRAAALLDDLPALRFVFAGEFKNGEAEALGRRLAAEPRVRGRVDFLGPVGEAEADELLRGAAVLVMPARQAEGQPLVILEAFRFGTPVVATRSGCIPDTVDDGVDGVLVDAARPDAIAAAVRDLVTEPDRWLQMSAAAREAYERRFTAERWVESMSRVFASAARPAIGRRTLGRDSTR